MAGAQRPDECRDARSPRERLGLGAVDEVRTAHRRTRQRFAVPPDRGTASAPRGRAGGPRIRPVVAREWLRADRPDRWWGRKTAWRARRAPGPRPGVPGRITAFLHDWRLATANGVSAQRMYTAGATLGVATKANNGPSRPPDPVPVHPAPAAAPALRPHRVLRRPHPRQPHRPLRPRRFCAAPTPPATTPAPAAAASGPRSAADAGVTATGVAPAASVRRACYAAHSARASWGGPWRRLIPSTRHRAPRPTPGDPDGGWRCPPIRCNPGGRPDNPTSGPAPVADPIASAARPDLTDAVDPARLQVPEHPRRRPPRRHPRGDP